MGLPEYRVRSVIPPEEMDEKVGKLLTPEDFNVLLVNKARVYKPDGSLLCVYLPKAIPEDVAEDVRGTLSAIKAATTNRGMAAGMPRVARVAGGRTHTKPVNSSIIGAFDPMGPQTYCRLTAYTAKEADKYRSLFPYFQVVARLFEEHVPDRYRRQMDFVAQTKPEWVVPGTPFTTVTVNNTWATAVHTDKGDLDEGFSCLAVLRVGHFLGGTLVFPRYRVGADLGDRDVILMNAHDWHGNVPIVKLSADAERVSTVLYYRTRMRECDSLNEEESKRLATAERRAALVGE